MDMQTTQDIRENYGECPAQAERLDIKQTGNTQTPCQKCTSIYLALRDRSDFDKSFLRQYNRLPAQYNTQLDTLIFAP